MTAAVSAAALYWSRRRRLSRLIAQMITPWASGLSVTEGQYVTTDTGQRVVRAGSTGVTGATAPTGLVSFDGVIEWVTVPLTSLVLLNYLGVNTP